MPPAKKKKSPGNSPGNIPAPMTAGGDSEDWVKGKANHKRIGNCFLAHSQNPKWGLDWDKVPEAELREQDFWGSFATYLTEIYEIAAGQKNPGKNLSSKSAVNAWSGLIDDFKSRFGKSASQETKARPPPTPARPFPPRTPRQHAPNVPMRLMTVCRAAPRRTS